jgi:hypothetical protein
MQTPKIKYAEDISFLQTALVAGSYTCGNSPFPALARLSTTAKLLISNLLSAWQHERDITKEPKRRTFPYVQTGILVLVGGMF